MSTTTLVDPPPAYQYPDADTKDDTKEKGVSESEKREPDSPAVDIKDISEAEKKELIQADAASVTSDVTTITPYTLTFEPVKTLVVNARGIDMIRIPTPSKEMQIDILNRDGTIAYQSTRKVRSSGNAVLTNSDGSPLIATEYFFGPKKDPILHVIDNMTGGTNDVKTVSKWTSRSHEFLLPDGRSIKWEYKKEQGFGGPNKKGTALVMTVDGKRVAALIRNDETRTPGAKSCTAGNGGELVLGEDVGTEKGVTEELVVAGCLLMLKKEIDRRRTVQFMMIAAAVS
jgi:hypothetical protein